MVVLAVVNFPVMLQLITILNRCHRFPGFVYHQARFSSDHKSIEIAVRPRKGSAAVCSRCHRPARGYDQLAERRFEFIPFWGFLVFLLYSRRRVDCRCILNPARPAALVGDIHSSLLTTSPRNRRESRNVPGALKPDQPTEPAPCKRVATLVNLEREEFNADPGIRSGSDIGIRVYCSRLVRTSGAEAYYAGGL